MQLGAERYFPLTEKQLGVPAAECSERSRLMGHVQFPETPVLWEAMWIPEED